MKHYLELDGKTGLLYEYSKEYQEGFEEYKSSTGNVSYRRYAKKGVYGTLKTVYVGEGNRGVQLRLVLTNGEEYYMVKLPLFTPRGDFDSFSESIISLLPNMELGKDYRVYPYVMEVEVEKDGKTKKYENRGVSVKEATIDGQGLGEVGAVVDKALIFPKKGDKYDPKNPNMIPPLEFTQNIAKKWTPTAVSLAIQKDFLEKKLKEALEVLDSNSNSEQTTNNQEATNPAQQTPAQAIAAKKARPAATAELEPEDDEDDVPF